jgi:hypothetical protein
LPAFIYRTAEWISIFLCFNLIEFFYNFGREICVLFERILYNMPNFKI